VGGSGIDFTTLYETERDGMARSLLVIGGDADAARRDDRTAIVLHSEPGRVGLTTVTAVDTVTAATTTINDAVPDGFNVIAAR
jgi:hypothetical protein